MEGYRHFTLVVVGEHPEELLPKYDSTKKESPYVVYEYSKAKEYHQQRLSFLRAILERDDLRENMRILVEEELHDLENMDDIDYFINLCNEDDCELDENTGNGISTKNPAGKYDTCKLGKNLSMPLITLKGEEVFTALKKDIDWDKIHLAGQETYAAAWDMVMEGKKPQNDYEQNIYDNMKYRTAYFQTFGTRENYIASSTAFWGYAFLNKEGWIDLDDSGETQFEWCKNFYNRFIEPLGENERISIYECTRN